MKLLNRKRYTSLAAGMAIMFATAQPAQAITVDIFGVIDAFNTTVNPLTDVYGDVSIPGGDRTGFAGLVVGNTVQLTVTYDETDVTGVGIEEIAFSSMTIDFINSSGFSAVSYIPDNTDEYDGNFLYFLDGSLFDFDLEAYAEDDSTFDYLQFGNADNDDDDYFFQIYDYAAGEDEDEEEVILLGHFNILPPTTVVPVPAAVWLFGSGLIGLVGVARRRT